MGIDIDDVMEIKVSINSKNIPCVVITKIPKSSGLYNSKYWISSNEEDESFVPKTGEDIDLLGYNIFDRISKEGRKYGVLLTLISQRPVELSETVMSQCANFLIFKTTHPRDIEYITRMVPYITEEIIEKQKGLQPGYCLAFGNAFKVPIIIRMDIPNPVPNSSNVNVIKEWEMNK